MRPGLYPKLLLLVGGLLLSCGPGGEDAKSPSHDGHLSLSASLPLARVDTAQRRWVFAAEEVSAGRGWRYGETFDADENLWVPADRRAFGSIAIPPEASKGRVTARTVRARGGDLRARIREGKAIWTEFVVSPQGTSATFSIPPGEQRLNRQLTFEWERLEGTRGSKNRVAWGDLEWIDGEDGSLPRVNLKTESLGLPGGSKVTWNLRLPSAAFLEIPRLVGVGNLEVTLWRHGETLRQHQVEAPQRELRFPVPEGKGEFVRVQLQARGPRDQELQLRRPRLSWVLSTLASTTPSRSSSPRANAKPNILLYLVDTLRADRVGVYGSERGLTPRLDALAAEGTVVERALAQSPWTRPSTASLFTGRWPLAHGVNTKESALPEHLPTLAKRLAEAGYTTAGFVANRQVSATFGFDRGFHLYREVQGDNRYLMDSSSTLNQEVKTWLEEKPSAPFFLYVHTIDPHAPYNPVDPYREAFAPGVQTPEVPRRARRNLKRLAKRLERDASTAEAWAPTLGSVTWMIGLERGWLKPTPTMVEGIERLYDAEVAANDERFGELLDSLESHGQLENTLVVIVSDHGDEFLEHGQWQHGKTFYDEVLRVPMVLRAPQARPLPSRIEHGEHLDLHATLLDAAGLEGESHGRSFFHELHGSSTSFSWLDDGGLRGAAVEEGGWKWIRFDRPVVREELYYLEDDPKEKKNRAQAEPEICAYFAQRLHQYRTLHESVAGKTVEVDEETRQQLEALGYL